MYIGANVVQDVVLRKIMPSDLVVAPAKLLQRPQCVDSSQSHDRYETSKSEDQCHAGTSEKYPAGLLGIRYVDFTHLSSILLESLLNLSCLPSFLSKNTKTMVYQDYAIRRMLLM